MLEEGPSLEDFLSGKVSLFNYIKLISEIMRINKKICK